MRADVLEQYAMLLNLLFVLFLQYTMCVTKKRKQTHTNRLLVGRLLDIGKECACCQQTGNHEPEDQPHAHLQGKLHVFHQLRRKLYAEH